MTWTYDAWSISTDLGKIRLIIGDVNSADEILSDEEIAYAQTLDTDIRLIAARCCDFIIAKKARDVDRNNLGMSANRSQVIQHYIDLRDNLREEARNERDDIAEVFVGGVSQASKDSLTSDTDLVQPSAVRGQWDND